MIPVNEFSLVGNEAKYLKECVDSGWISSEGPFVRRFEEEFASFVGVKYGIAVCNGTAALETALFALGIKAGDEVIMPSFTIISCAIACIRLGAKPVLVDIEPDNCTIDVNQIEGRITPKTKAIMPVHIYGHPVDMDKVFELAEKYKLKIIADFAEAQGAQYYSNKKRKWMQCGAMSDVSATSFYANKIITTGEGGMVVTDNPEYAGKSRAYRNLCFGIDERFSHDELGYNFRMTNLQAAIGVARLEQVDKFIKIKRKLAEHYKTRLAEIKQIRFLTEKSYAKSVYWVYAIELKPEFGVDAKELMVRLRKYGVETRPFFKGMHTQPVFVKSGLFRGEKYPNTDFAYKYGLYLPSGLALTENQIDKVVEALREALK
ncbi:MAG: DegT/DnrJ/EryC1/StrS family aminotransferase [Candidatus Omnitrophica bacterium]|nr:DegT/DnrJ/EryC1/StrS family aminotransferase [Candidatus Omnitrophota bacterium]